MHPTSDPSQAYTLFTPDMITDDDITNERADAEMHDVTQDVRIDTENVNGQRTCKDTKQNRPDGKIRKMNIEKMDIHLMEGEARGQSEAIALLKSDKAFVLEEIYISGIPASKPA